MTLPASGAISLSQVAVELGRASNATTSLGETAVRNLAGVASGPNSLNVLHGKSSYTPMTVMPSDDNRSYSSFSSGGTAYAYPSVSVTGGTGGYTYSWSFTSNPQGASLANASAAQCTVSKTFVKTSTGAYSAVLQCVVQDNTGHVVTAYNINAGADWEYA